MAWENITEATALELSGKKFDPEITYVMLERDIYPKTVKIKLSELKKWINSEINASLEEVSRRANVGYLHGQKLGPVRKGIY